MTEDVPNDDPIFTVDDPFQTSKDLSFHVREKVTRQQTAVVDGSFDLEGADAEIVERVANRLAALANWHADVVRTFRAGDMVTHLPTCESLILAGADPERGEVYPTGSSGSVIKAIDCVPIERATEKDFENFLARALELEESDVRRKAAVRTIARCKKAADEAAKRAAEHRPA